MPPTTATTPHPAALTATLTSPTMLQLARELGLSRRTVSSVVNGKAAERAISPATAERVRAYLQARGYVPSKQAVALKSGARGTVGVLHSGRLYSHLVDAFNRLVDEASSQPAGVEIVVTPREQIVAGFRELVSRGVSKLVWIQAAPTGRELDQAEHILPLFAGRTVVLYNYRFDSGDWDQRLAAAGVYQVGVDRSAAYAMQARFLHQLGHRHIAFPDSETPLPGTPADSKTVVFEQHGLTVHRTAPLQRPAATAPTAYDAASAMARALHACRRQAPITAAVFQDDLIAGFALAELTRLGLRIPTDLTVMGFDGLEITRLTTPHLTSLAMPVSAMVDRVLKILRRPPAAHRHCFAMTLAPGGSHAPAPTLKGEK